MRQGVLYLMVVNLPTEREVEKAEREVRQQEVGMGR